MPIRDSCRMLVATLALLLAVAPAATALQTPSPPRHPALPAAGGPFVDSVLRTLSLEEKLGQLTQVAGRGTPTGPGVRTGGEGEIRAGRIGSFLGVFGAATTRQLQRIAVEESPRRIPLLFGHDVIHGFRTIFPVPLAEASSWDPAAVSRAARVAATEGSAAGLHWTFAPMVDIARDPRWGRIVEGSGEDPFLGAVMAAARVRGFQGTDLTASNTLLATAKHFVGYGAAEGGRDYNTTEMTPQTLWDVYLPPFHAAVEAGAWSVMAGFNEIGGTPMHASDRLIDGVLRAEWGWNGLLVSDWTGVLELLAHRVAADSAEAGRRALEAGVDMDMVSEIYIHALAPLVRDGRIPMAQVDDAVRRVLMAKYALGLFTDPYRYSDVAREKATLLSAANRAASREMARASVVLLRNDTLAGRTVLPIARSTRTIAVVGALAADARSAIGNWAADGRADEAVTVLDGIRRAVPPTARVLHAKGAETTGSDSSGFAEAVRVARESDVVVMVVGEREDQSAEANSRASIELPGVQDALVRAVHATGTPMVVVLMNGRPLATPWIAEHVPAVVEAWFLGSEMGNALADILFGDVNPSGKLPVTIPRATGQVPLYYNHKSTGRPPREGEKYTSKYIDLPFTPLYPFGHGLSYTTFAYGEPALSRPTIGARDTLTVTVEVRNTGRRAGTEVAQLYVTDDVATLARPVKELRGFQRVTLAPGEAKRVTFTLVPADLTFHDEELALVAEPGTFRIHVGGSSATGVEGRFTLALDADCARLEMPRSYARFTWNTDGSMRPPRSAPMTCKARSPR